GSLPWWNLPVPPNPLHTPIGGIPDELRRRRRSTPPKGRRSGVGVRPQPRPDRLLAALLRLPDAADRGRDRVFLQPSTRPLQLHVAGLYMGQLEGLGLGSGPEERDGALARDRSRGEHRCDGARDARCPCSRPVRLPWPRLDERARLPAALDARDR